MTATPQPAVDRVRSRLDAAGVSYEIVEHEPTYTSADEARASGQSLPETAKTLVLVDREEVRLAVVPASRRLDLERARRALRAGAHLRLATEEEVGAVFPGYAIGALPPFAGDAVPEVIDLRLIHRDRVLCSAGDHRHAVLLDPHELLRLAEPRVADICEHVPDEHRFTELPRV